MTHAQVTASEFTEELHPRAPAGSSTGGQFAKDGGSKSTTPARKAAPAKTTPKRKPAQRRDIPAGQLGFDGVSGTGYGVKGGDKRVRALQEELNRLGLTDRRGRKLRVDGQLGPLTTQATKTAQERLGMNPTGIIVPAFIDRLRATKAMPAAKRAAPRSRMPRKQVRAKFDPAQKRDPDGTWGDGIPGASMLKDALKLADRIELEDGEKLAGSGRLNLDSPTGVEVVWAAVDRPGGREYRIGTIPEDDVGKWRAAERGATAPLSSESASRLVDDLSAAEGKAVDLAAEAEDAWNTGEAPTDPVLRGDVPVAQGTIDSEWGPIDWSVYLDDSEPVSWVTDFKVGTEPGLDSVKLDSDGLTKLVEGLGAVISTPVAAAAKAPYGPKSEVDYADPGMRPDKKARYPLDSEAHCRAAWSYINMPRNAAKYTADQLAKIKAKIKAAGRKYGIEFADDAKKVSAAEMRGIELARPGKWNLASGPMEITDLHITDAARHAQRKGARPGYVKIGHTDKRFAVGDGEPALGWVHNVRREVDDRGPVLLGDIEDMPEWFAAAARKHWPYRSIEGWADYTDPETGERYALVVDGVAVLGVTPPGMTSLQSLRDLPQAVGAAAGSGTRVVASMAPAPPAEEPEVEESGMDPAKFREALGLAPDASDDEVRSAFDVAYPPPTPAPAPVQASLFAEEPPKKAPPTKMPEGVKVIAASVWDETQKTIQSLTDFVAKTKRDERDEVIATAVKAGKFLPAQRLYFTNLWDEAPDRTRELINGLMPNSALAVLAAGYANGPEFEEDELDREIARLSRKEPSNG